MLSFTERRVDSRTRAKTFAVGLIVSCSIAFAPNVIAQESTPNLSPPKDIKPSVKEGRDPANLPPSRVHKQVKVDSTVVYSLQLDPSISSGDGRDRRLRIGDVKPLPLNPLVHCKWFDLPRGAYVGILAIEIKGAIRTRVHFVDVGMTAGAKLYIYSMTNPEDLYGPYEGQGPFKDGAFWTPPIEGERVVVEYLSPSSPFIEVTRGRPFRISEVSRVLRN